jgi:hypothetical protein
MKKQACLQYAKTLLTLETVRYFELHMESSEAMDELAAALREVGCEPEALYEQLLLRVRCPRFRAEATG